MEVTYYRDSEHNYMVIPSPGEENTSGYPYRMLELNRIDGLLPCSLRYIDGNTYMYYEITGKQNLSGLFGGHKIPGPELWAFLRALYGISSSLSEYLLDVAQILLAPDHIYFEFRTGRFQFTYLPGEVSEPEVFRFLADRIDSRDKRAAAAAYRLSAAAKDGRTKMWEELRALIEEEEGRSLVSPYDRAALSGNTEAADRTVYGHMAEETAADQPSEGYAADTAGETTEVRAGRAKKWCRNKERVPGRPRKRGQMLFIVLSLAACAGLFAVQYAVSMSQREQRLCLVGAALWLLIAVLLAADLLIKRRKENGQAPKEAEEEYRISGEEYYPVARQGSAQDYMIGGRLETSRLHNDSSCNLYGISNSVKGMVINLSKLPVTLGKAERYVDVMIDDPFVSRVHARVYRQETGNTALQDLGSTNGTLINNVLLGPNESHILVPGDTVRIGRAEYEYR